MTAIRFAFLSSVLMFSMLVTVLMCSALMTAAYASDSFPWETSESGYVRGRILSAVNNFGAGSHFIGGIQLKLEEGWYLYLGADKNGTSEQKRPAVFDWSGSENIADVEIGWVVPKRLTPEGGRRLGYDKSFVLPLVFHVKEDAFFLHADLKLALVVCNDVAGCVTQHLALDYDIVKGDDEAQDSMMAPVLGHVVKRVPYDGDTKEMRIDHVVVSQDALVATVWSESGFDQADLYVEGDGFLLESVPEITIDPDDSHKARILIGAPADVDNLSQRLAGSTVNVVFALGTTAIKKEFSL